MGVFYLARILISLLLGGLITQWWYRNMGNKKDFIILLWVLFIQSPFLYQKIANQTLKPPSNYDFLSIPTLFYILLYTGIIGLGLHLILRLETIIRDQKR